MHIDDTDGIPAFLRRPITPEYLANLKRITARYRQPKIKNPPKRITRRMRTGLGAAFGVGIKKIAGA